MYVFYIDESGDPGTGTRNFVLAAVGVHEGQWQSVAGKMDDLQTKYFPNLTEPIELHSYDARHGQGIFKGMPKEERQAFETELYDMIRAHPSGLVLFGIIIDKPSRPPDEAPYDRALEDLISRLDLSLKRRFAMGDPQKGTIVIDNTTLRDRLRPLFDRWRRQGTRWGATYNLIETIFFLESGSSRIVQIADFVAGAVFQSYEHGKSAAFQSIMRKFERDPDTGKIHGLRHVTSDRSCGCFACLQRAFP